MDTGRRSAKMYIAMNLWQDVMIRVPRNCVSNHVDDGYKGMLVVRSELKSMCSTAIAPR